ncbi:MAG: aminotransferase class I/II-fold pyridoxal phosphate-dependent enzyme [Candidatus Tectomicrobia bacterium]|nr:aminotransferase class I/II-fold pyridoxal phosphate-dependent enzyme [Candidatus Tectomicrobia bacterium]
MRPEFFGGFPGARFYGGEERDAVAEVVAAQSPYRFYGLALKGKAEELERRACELFGRRHAVALSSGTSALHAALFALGVGAGDEVIMPAYAWVSDLMAILALGGAPVIAPIDATLGLDAERLGACCGERTRAILAVHMRGVPCDLPAIRDLARRRGIGVVEDGAQCLGGVVAGKPVGAGGDVSVLSFQYNKLITAGEGGMLLTDDPQLHERAYRFHDLGMLRHAGGGDPEGLEAIASFGMNYRITELQAALLLAQLEKLPRILGGLQASYAAALEMGAERLAALGLRERPTPPGAARNHAFLCLVAESPEAARQAAAALEDEGLPVQRCARLDGHHVDVWEAYLQRTGLTYRSLAGEESRARLERSLFLEVASVSVGAP